MNNKLLPVLLLSIAVIAGTATITDAFAQTNTERLATIADTTSDTNSVVHMIMEALDDIVDSITSLTSSISQLSDSVDSSTSTITSKLTNIEDTLAENASITSTLDDIAADVNTLMTSVEHIDEHVMSIGDTDALQAIVNDLSTSTTSKLNSLEANIDQRFNAVETQLMAISEKLGTVQAGVVPTTAPSNIPALSSDVENNVIKASYYATTFDGDIEKWPGEGNDKNYVLPYDFTFSCSAPVVIRTVSVQADGPLLYKHATEAPNATDANSYRHPLQTRYYYNSATTTGDPGLVELDRTTIKVNGRYIVDTDFQATPDGSKIVTNKVQSFNLMQLPAGQSLNFETEINFRAYTMTDHESSVDITNEDEETTAYRVVKLYPEGGISMGTTAVDGSDVTHDNVNVYGNLTEGSAESLDEFDFNIFKVNVDYISLTGSDADCKLSLPDADVRRSFDDILIVPLEATGTGLIKEITEVEVYCNDKSAEIRSTGHRSVHSAGSGVIAAATLTFEAGGESMSLGLAGDDEPLTHKAGEKRIVFDSGNLKISGSVPQVNAILLSLEYFTVKGNTCSVVTQ